MKDWFIYILKTFILSKNSSQKAKNSIFVIIKILKMRAGY